jgi:hypothetical protein
MQRRDSIRTVLYKACPQCHGDLILDANLQPSLTNEIPLDYVCLQCGRRLVGVTRVSGEERAVSHRAAIRGGPGMEHTDLRPRQRARYVSLENPLTVEGYVDELCQNMAEAHLELRSVLPVVRGGDTVGFWLFFSWPGAGRHAES